VREDIPEVRRPIKTVFVAARTGHAPERLLDELERLGCELDGPHSSITAIRQRFAPGSVDLGVLDFRLDDGSTFALEQTFRASRTPVLYLVSTGHAKTPVRLRSGALVSFAATCPVADILDIIEGG
jgi:hypothetical protein